VETIEKSYENQGYGIYGFKFTINCDSSFMWQDEQTLIYLSSATPVTPSTPVTLRVNNTSQLCGYTYPTLIIKTGSVSATPTSITLQCVTDNNRLVQLTNISANDTIILTASPNLISATVTSDIYSKFNKKWLRLLQGINSIAVSSVGIRVTEIQIKYQNARLVTFFDS
jgi:hypothetical protein